MNYKEFIEKLGENPERFEWKEGEHEGEEGVFVKNLQYETVTHFTREIIEQHDFWFLETKTHHGKNIEQITRVTGFFSKVGSWNKGKTGELKQRDRVEIR